MEAPDRDEARMMKLYAGLAIGAVVAMIGGSVAWTWLRAPDDAFASCRAGAIAGGTAAIGGPFTLVSETGTTVTEADVITRPTLVYFGYTFCPDVCPFDVARNADAADILAERGEDVGLVFITVDPERDTPERLAEFTDFMHPGMIGLTGSAEQVRRASQAYRTYYRKQDGDDEFYLVDHSTFTYLVLPETGFVEFYRREVTPEEMADSVSCFAAAAARG
jgi:protein SCO1